MIFEQTRGNHFVPWIDGEPFYTRLLQALRQAQESFWAIVSFIQPTFAFPDGTSWLDALDEAAARGVDVRVLYWSNPTFFQTDHIFSATPEHIQELSSRGTTWSTRFDASLTPAHCHHQKSYVVDAHTPDAIGFVGGMVLSNSTIATPGHATGPGKHDVFAEWRGPIASDIARNFIQRWNHANQPTAARGVLGATERHDITAAPRAQPDAGSVSARLSRTVAPGYYPWAPDGEADIKREYEAAIRDAKHSIYIENQHPGEASILEALIDAAARGVEILQVVPAAPMGAIIHEKRRGKSSPYHHTFSLLDELDTFDNFTLAGLYRHAPDPEPIYVHAKLCVIDGAWATIGSANLVDLSMLPDHTELNVSMWDDVAASDLLARLLEEHTGEHSATNAHDRITSARQVAAENAVRLSAQEPLVGLLVRLDASTYAT